MSKENYEKSSLQHSTNIYIPKKNKYPSLFSKNELNYLIIIIFGTSKNV